MCFIVIAILLQTFEKVVHSSNPLVFKRLVDVLSSEGDFESKKNDVFYYIGLFIFLNVLGGTIWTVKDYFLGFACEKLDNDMKVELYTNV